MSITSLQLILAVVAYGKLIVLLAFFGLEAVGSVSYVTALVSLLSIVSQMYNNQGVQVSYIRSKPRLARMYKDAMHHLSLYTGIFAICIFLLINFLGVTKIPFEYMPIICAAIMAAIYNGAYDFQCTVNNRVDTYLKSQIYGSIVFFGFAILIYYYEINIQFLVVLYPIQVLSSFIYYRLEFISHLPKADYSSINCLIKSYVRLQKKHLTLNAIPVTSVTCDYIIKNVFITASGPVLVGLFQIIQSIDSLIGNIFAGPIYRKAIYDYTRNRYTTIDSRFILYIKKLALPIFLISAALIILKIVNIYHYGPYVKQLILVNDHIWLFVAFFISKYFTLVWGFIGQILLSGSRSNAVVCGEVAFKMISTFLTIFLFFYMADDIYSYIYSYTMTSILLLYFGILQLVKFGRSI